MSFSRVLLVNTGVVSKLTEDVTFRLFLLFRQTLKRKNCLNRYFSAKRLIVNSWSFRYRGFEIFLTLFFPVCVPRRLFKLNMNNRASGENSTLISRKFLLK